MPDGAVRFRGRREPMIRADRAIPPIVLLACPALVGGCGSSGKSSSSPPPSTQSPVTTASTAITASTARTTGTTTRTTTTATTASTPSGANESSEYRACLDRVRATPYETEEARKTAERACSALQRANPAAAREQAKRNCLKAAAAAYHDKPAALKVAQAQ